MANENMNVVQVAIDCYRGVTSQYSTAQTMDSLRQALVEANGGKTYIDMKSLRGGNSDKLFTLIEEILSETVLEGLQGNEFFTNFVEYRNLALGDKNIFEVEDSDLFIVSEAATGTQGIRRQRLGGVTTTSIPTSFHVVKIYEELNRVLSGQVDFNYFINKVAESFQKKILDEVFTVFSGITSNDLGGATYYRDTTAGSYSESELLDMVGHLEAATGQAVTIVGTKKALRNLAPSIQGAESKSDLYNLGYYGTFYGSACMALPQRHRVGTTTFMFSDKELWLIAGDPKFIKFVYEGNPLVIMGNPTDNADLTQELEHALAA